MVDGRWQSATPRLSIEIGSIDFAVQPQLQAEAVLLNLLQRAMSDAMDRMPGIS
jgi:hypothetical protein